MGKQKGSSSAPVKEEKVEVAIPQKRPPRGHRQRGAGTVITAPPPVVTDDGIRLAPHMRLPSTLLQEFCQKEKKPRPVYENCPSETTEAAQKFRMRVKMVDLKNSRNDLSFTPNQGCSSDKLARDYAALLALYHFQPSLPLERKLPEPFSTSWLDMVQSDVQKKPSTRVPEGSLSGSKVTQELKPNTKKKNTESTSTSGGSEAERKTINDSSRAIMTGQDNDMKPSSTPFSLAPVLGLQSEQRYASQAERERVEGEERRRAGTASDRTYAEV
jgi:hypothetical protein